MTHRNEWHNLYHLLTPNEIQEILEEMQYRILTPPFLRRKRIISWLATLSCLVLILGLALFCLTTPSAPFMDRFLLSVVGGYLIALHILAYRFFQDWYHKNQTIRKNSYMN